jgi:hypothetical protein
LAKELLRETFWRGEYGVSGSNIDDYLTLDGLLGGSLQQFSVLISVTISKPCPVYTMWLFQNSSVRVEIQQFHHREGSNKCMSTTLMKQHEREPRR